MHERLKGIKSIAIYSVLWIFCSILLIVIFRGKSFIFRGGPGDPGDGIYQHLASFFYLCDYLKYLIYNCQIKGFYNFTLGQGMDIITTLNSYDFTDPVSAFCAFIFPLTRTMRYTLMIFVKLYFIGVSFIFYCYTVDIKDTLATAAGAIAYVFSGAILFMVARHPNFINWAYFLPFILGGVELYLRKKQKWPLILFIFLNILTSYYTFYVDVVLVILYVLVHVIYHIIQDRRLIFEETKKIFKLAGVCCIGVLLSSVVFFPTIYSYLNQDRAAAFTGYLISVWHYPLQYYIKLIEDIFIAFRSPGFSGFLGINVVVIIPLILIFIKKEHIVLKILLAISFFMMCIPMAGIIMNGFGYVANRWTFVVPFYTSVVFVYMFADIEKMLSKEKAFVFLGTLAYIFICFLHTATNTDPQKYSALLILAAVVGAVGIYLHYKWPKFRIFMVFLVFIGACFQIYFTFSKDAGNYIKLYSDKSRVSSAALLNQSNSAAVNLGDEFYRIEMEEEHPAFNVYNGAKSTGFYWSIVPSHVMEYYTHLGIDSVVQNCNVYNLDGRTGLLALGSVKYYTRPTKKDGLVPYGYEKIVSKDKRYQIFKNKYALPVGYTYSSYIPINIYRSMNDIEKEQILLQGAVLETSLLNFKLTNINTDYSILDYEITDKKNLNIDNGKIKVIGTPGTITINTTVPNDSEIYICIRGTKLTQNNRGSFNIRASRKNINYVVTKGARITNLNYQWPVLRDSVVFNLGYGHAGPNTVTLTFYSKGVLLYDDLQIIAVPMKPYVTRVEKLREHVLKNITVEDDKVTGTISLPESRILQLSIPYSKGWKALVDGKEVTLLKSNIMYMALPMEAGNHTIELNYRTPYMKEGFIITGITITLLGLYEILCRRKKRNSVV